MTLNLSRMRFARASNFRDEAVRKLSRRTQRGLASTTDLSTDTQLTNSATLFPETGLK